MPAPIRAPMPRQTTLVSESDRLSPLLDTPVAPLCSPPASFCSRSIDLRDQIFDIHSPPPLRPIGVVDLRLCKKLSLRRSFR